MLRLPDERTRSSAEVRPARPGLLRVCAYLPPAAGITGLRVLLVADLLARAAELGNLQVLTALVPDGEVPGPESAAERAAGALGIHPPAVRAAAGDAPALLGGPVDVRVVGGADADDGLTGVVTRVGDVRAAGAGGRDAVTADLLAGNEPEPLGVRLALMSFPSRQPADLTDGVLADARETVRGWRRLVARWAQEPSRPVPAYLAEQARAAFGDLDAPSAIAMLHGLARDESVPAGARFETFLYVDRLLGLELPSWIGKPD